MYSFKQIEGKGGGGGYIFWFVGYFGTTSTKAELVNCKNIIPEKEKFILEYNSVQQN